MADSVVLDTAVLAPLVGVFLPILVAVITQKVTHSGVKAVVLAALSAVSGVLVAAQQAGGLVTKEAVTAAFLTWVVAVATYYGFWKPTETSVKVADATESVHLPGI